MTNFSVRAKIAEQKRGADGVKTAVLREGRAGLEFIWAAAQAQRYVCHFTLDKTYVMTYRRIVSNFTIFEVYHAHINSN